MGTGPERLSVRQPRRAVVIGGSGFIGSVIVHRLAAAGWQVTVPTRRRDSARHLLPLPRVDVVQARLDDAASLDALLAGSDAVIQLVGVLHSPRGQIGSGYGTAFAQAHVELPRQVAAACVRLGVPRLLHMSALGADAKGPSMYQRSKADGEQAVHDATRGSATAVTVFRPSVVFGPGDRFLNLFARLQRFLPVMLLAGANTRFQPVHVSDVANAFIHAIDRRETFGQTYELVGPEVFTLEELVRMAGRAVGTERMVIGLPSSIGRLQALAFELLPGEPLMSRDNIDSMNVDNVGTRPLDTPIDPALGVRPTPLTGSLAEMLTQAGSCDRLNPLRARARR